jgi:Sulfotransferase domain
MLSLPADVGFIWEPLSPSSSKGICAAEINEWFLHIHEGNEEEYLQAIQDVVEFKYNYLAELKKTTSIRRLARFFRDAYIINNHRMHNCRPLLKDPIALMSAEWLQHTFDMQVIVLIRNPFAFCASIRKQGFNNHPFEHLLRQDDLLDKYLFSFRDEIESSSKSTKSVIEQGCLLWNIIHHVIHEYKRSHKDWMFIRHEDISLDPLEGFRKMYQALDIEFSNEIEEKIAQTCGLRNFNCKDNNDMRRDSVKNLHLWKKSITSVEYDLIASKTELYMSKFYPDWNVLL